MTVPVTVNAWPASTDDGAESDTDMAGVGSPMMTVAPIPTGSEKVDGARKLEAFSR